MARPTKTKILVFVAFFGFILCQWVIVYRNVGKTKPDFLHSTINKEFVYLVQAESCLPSYFTQENVTGNATACKCDVIVLSYKAECRVRPVEANVEHVQYIYGPNTTWTSGRNTLYRYAKKLNVNYRYYIFADDDLRLAYNPYINASETNKPELRTFEKFLLDVEPVLGCVNYLVHHQASSMRTIRRNCLNKPDLSLLPMIHFDPILNAFHRDALEELLPYPEDYDKECWWHSNRFTSIAIEFRFRGQAVMFPGITVTNFKHRPYPRKNRNATAVINTAIDKEIAKLPESYRHHFAVRGYKDNPGNYGYGYSPTACMEVIPHQTIKPYSCYEKFPMSNYKSYDDVFNETALGIDLDKH